MEPIARSSEDFLKRRNLEPHADDLVAESLK